MRIVASVVAVFVLAGWLAAPATAQTPQATLPSQCFDQKIAP